MIIKKVRLAWAQYLFQPETFNGDVKYKINIIVPKNHPQIRDLKSAIVSAIKKKFDSAAGLTNPLHDCDKNGASAEHPYLTNCYTLLLYTKKPPKVTDQTGKAITQQDGVIYSGCYVDVELSFKAWDIGDSNSLGRYVNSVQFVQDGPQLDGEAVNSGYLRGYAMSTPLSKPTPSEEEQLWNDLNKPQEWDDPRDEEQFWKNMKKAEASYGASYDDGEADIPF